MSYTFRVVFDGVSAYVPNKPFFNDIRAQDRLEQRESQREQPTPPPTTEPGELGEKWEAATDVETMAVLLPDLRRPEPPRVPRNSGLKFPLFREPHFPLLWFRLDDLRERTTRRVDLVCRDISEKNENGVLFLRQEQIRFQLKAENERSFSFADWTPYDPAQPLPELDRPEQVESLWWLPDLSRIANNFPGASKVRRDVLPSYRGPFPEGLIARIECTGGRLRTYDFNRDVNGVPLQWRFAKPADAWSTGTWNRALANSVALEFFDVTGEVSIELRRLANEVVIEHLVLAPAPGASRPVLEIQISNREPDLLFREEGFGRLALPDVDFQPFYEKLSVFGGEVADLPVPHPARFTFFGIQEKPCAGTVINT